MLIRIFLYIKTNILRGSAYLNFDFALPGEPATLHDCKTSIFTRVRLKLYSLGSVCLSVSSQQPVAGTDHGQGGGRGDGSQQAHTLLSLHSAAKVRGKLWVVPASSSREFPRQLGSGDNLSMEDAERRGSVNMTIIRVETILGASISILICPCLTTISHNKICRFLPRLSILLCSPLKFLKRVDVSMVRSRH